jgi:hypothetical protein
MKGAVMKRVNFFLIVIVLLGVLGSPLPERGQTTIYISEILTRIPCRCNCLQGIFRCFAIELGWYA